jgi:hypothetical protein
LDWDELEDEVVGEFVLGVIKLVPENRKHKGYRPSVVFHKVYRVDNPRLSSDTPIKYVRVVRVARLSFAKVPTSVEG